MSSFESEVIHPAVHGLFRRKGERGRIKPARIDKRSVEFKAYQSQTKAFEVDLGPLNEGERLINQEIFWDSWTLHCFRRTILKSGTQDPFLVLIKNEKYARTYGSIVNRLVRHIVQLYGGDVRNAKAKLESLEEYVARTYGPDAQTQDNPGDGQAEPGEVEDGGDDQDREETGE